jgi:hypothetical protein
MHDTYGLLDWRGMHISCCAVFLSMHIDYALHIISMHSTMNANHHHGFRTRRLVPEPGFLVIRIPWPCFLKYLLISTL